MSRKIHRTNMLAEARAEALSLPPSVAVSYAPAAGRKVVPQFPADITDGLSAHTRRQIAEREAARQRIEDERAIRRNRNRFLTLAGALVISFMITYALGHLVPPAIGKTWGPYAFCITILLDSSFTFWAYVKRY